MRFVEFMLEGGWSMWFVLAFGLVTLAMSVSFLRQPNVRQADIVRSFSRATVFSIITGVSVNIAAVGAKVPANPEWANSPQIHLIVMQGIAEAIAPSSLGFTLLALAWLVVAVGQRKLGREQMTS
ncbi:MAG TPA: hypothetical protein VFQ35_28300 [Polyangiaceae bacterium]|nr:hypothetical protein [Polyangiaceae bacterium]